MSKITLKPISNEESDNKKISDASRLKISKIEVDESYQISVYDYISEQIKDENTNLFGIIDSARNDEVFRLLITGNVKYKSLFEGTMDVQSYGVSGFLVECKKESLLFRWMTEEAWGDNCCIFFSSNASFDDVFAHFQKFIRVYLEGDKVVLFRFYDPRVLRIFLPTCNKNEIELFFGEVLSFYSESLDPEIICTYKKSDRSNQNPVCISNIKIKLN